MLAATKKFAFAASGLGTIVFRRFVYPHKDSVDCTGATFKVRSRFPSEALRNCSLLLMVSWVWHLKFRVCIDCVDDIPDTMHHVRVSNTIRWHKVIGGTARKIANCTSKTNRWSDRAIGNIPMVLFVHDSSMSGGMVSCSSPPRLDERTFNNAVSKLSRELFEGMILHPVCFPEVGRPKLSVDILYLVSGTWVCSNSSNSMIATTTLFLVPLN